jgi:ribosome biogenesis protein Nip4
LQNDQNRQLTFSAPTREEKRHILEGLTRYLPSSAAKALLKGLHLLVGRGRREEVHALSPPLWKLYNKIRPYRHPYFAGLFLGELRKDEFRPSLHLLPSLVRKAKEGAIINVTSQDEQHFLYGKSVESTRADKFPKLEKQEIPVIVLNSQGKGLGFGAIVEIQKDKVRVENHQDIGWYLRRGH